MPWKYSADDSLFDIKTHTKRHIWLVNGDRAGTVCFDVREDTESTAPTNMADFLPVDALALQQLKRAQTAHSNFIANNFVLTISSNRPRVGSNYFNGSFCRFFRVGCLEEMQRLTCSGELFVL